MEVPLTVQGTALVAGGWYSARASVVSTVLFKREGVPATVECHTAYRSKECRYVYFTVHFVAVFFEQIPDFNV